MPRRSITFALAIPAMLGILVAGYLLLARSTAAQPGVIRHAGAISIAADNYTDLGHNRTRATGDIQLGRFLRVSGPGAYVEFARDYLVGHGTLVLASGGRSRELFSGDFSSANTELREGLINPGAGVSYDLNDLSGFVIKDRLIVTRISTITGIANGEARLALPGPAGNDLGTLYGPPISNDLDVATALAAFQIEPGADGPTVWAQLDPFYLPHAGLTIVAPSGAELRDGAITLSDAQIGSPTLFTNRTSPLGAVRIDPQAVELANLTVGSPDICFGQPCNTTRLKITGIQATLNNNQFNAEGNLVLNLPGNRQSARVIFTIGADGQNQPDTSNLRGTIAELNLTLAGSRLNLQQVQISTNGLGTDIATLKLPASLGNSSGSVTGVRINGSGLTLTGGSVTLPTIKIGDGSRVQIQQPTATIAVQGEGYSFSLSGNMLLNLPQNNQTVGIVATIDNIGELRGSVNQLTMRVAGATLQLNNLNVSKAGLAVQTGTLNLPASLGGVSGEVKDVQIGRDGLSIGGGSVTVPFRDFTIGSGSSGFAVSGASLRIDIAGDQTFQMTLNGKVAVRIPGASSTATGTIVLNSRGEVSGSIKSFSLSVAGLSFAVSNATIDSSGFSAQSASLQIPAAWGGASASVYNLRITSSGLSIGGGSFTLPTIRAGGFTVTASGALVPVSGGYEIRARGLFAIPGLSSGPGCAGIEAGLVLSTDGFSNNVMRIEPLDGPPDATPVIEALRSGDETLRDAEVAALRLRQVSLELKCKVLIGQTGFVVSRLAGTVTLSSGSTRVDVGISIETSSSLPVLGPLVRGDVDAYVQSNPFEMGLNGSLNVFIFQVGGANVKISEQRGFEATVWIQMVWGRGDLYVRAWSAYGQFNLTGRATITVGFAKGAIWRGCLKYPCCTLPSCSCAKRVWGVCVWPRCTGGGCSLCDGPCVDVPPFNLELGRVGTEFGRFAGDRWGFKGTVSVNFFGKDFGTGFFIDHRGNLTVGNVDNIRLVTSAQIARAYQTWTAAAAAGTLTANWQQDGISFPLQGDAAVTVPISNTSNVIFSLSRNQDTPKLTLVSPSNQQIGPTSLPSNASYQEIITYTLDSSLPALQFTGLAPELVGQVRVSGDYTAERDPTLAAECAVLQDGLVELIEQNLGVQASTELGRIRLVNATTDQFAVDLLVNDVLEQGASIGAAAPYSYLEVGTLTIKAVPRDTTTPVLAQTTLVLGADKVHSLVLTGSGGNYQLLVFDDSPTVPGAGMGRVRFINAAPGTSSNPVDVEIAGERLLFNAVGYSTNSDYVDFPAGTHEVVVSAAGSADVLQRTRIEVGAGDVITLVALDNSTTIRRYWLPMIFLPGGNSFPFTASRGALQQTGADALSLVQLRDVTLPAHIRLVHAIRSGPAIDASVGPNNTQFGPQRVFANIAYKGVSSYIDSEPGEFIINVTPNGATEPALFSGNTNLERNRDYTLIMLPGGNGVEPLLLHDDNRFPAVGNIRIRAVALDADAGPSDLVAISESGVVTRIGDALAYRGASGYSELPAGNYRLELRPAGSSNPVGSIPLQALKEGYTYTFFAFDGGTGAAPELLLSTDIKALRFIQEMYTLTGAEGGNWQMIAGGAGDPGNIGEQANYLLQVLGSNPAPAFSQVTATRIPNTNRATVSWRLTSDEPNTGINIYVSGGPISASTVVTDSNGITSTVQLPVYGGGLVAQNVTTTVDGTQQSYEIDLAGAESGSYYVWLEADDGRNTPTRAYARRAGVAYAQADYNERGEFQLAQSDLETLDISQTWNDTWNAALSANAEYRAVKLSWNAFPNPDADHYALQISGGDLDETLEIDVGDQREFTVDGLTPGVSYNFQVRVLDEEGNQSSLSETLPATPATAPFTLSGPANLGTLGRTPVSVELTLTNPGGIYPDYVELDTDNVPDGLALSFARLDTPSCGDNGTPPDGLFCPGPGGARVTMTVTPNGLTPSGAYTIDVVAVGGGVTRTLSLPVTVQGGDFTLSLSSYNVQLPLPNIAAGQTRGPAVDVNLTLNGFNDASNPVTLETYDVPPDVEVSFLRNGQPLDNPTIIAGETITLRLQVAGAPPLFRDPQNNSDPQSTSGELFIVGFASGHWDFADGLNIQTFNPNPVLNRVSAPGPGNYEAFAVAGGPATAMGIELVVPPQWAGGNVTLRPQAATLPPGTTVTLNGSPTASFNSSGNFAVNVAATVGAGVTPNWYYLNIEAVDAQNRVLYTLVTDFGVDIPNIDFDTDDDNATELKVAPGGSFSHSINITIPPGWSIPLTLGLELDYTDAFAFSSIEAVQLDDLGDPIGSPVSGADVITITSGPGDYTIQVTGVVAENAPEGRQKIWYNLRSDPVWTESRIFVDIGYDFDGLGREVQARSATPGQTISYTLPLYIPSTFEVGGIHVVLDEVLLDPEIDVAFRIFGSSDPFTDSLNLGPGDYLLEIQATSTANTAISEYWFFIDFRTPGANELLDYTEFVIDVTD